MTLPGKALPAVEVEQVVDNSEGVYQALSSLQEENTYQPLTDCMHAHAYRED